MKELIEKQREDFRKFAQWWWSEVNPKPDDVYNWHINSIKEILEAEVERNKEVMSAYTDYDSEPGEYTTEINLITENIEHLTNIINNLK